MKQGQTVQKQQENYIKNSIKQIKIYFLPTLTIATKNSATGITNYNVTEKDLYGEEKITDEHIENNLSVRSMLNKRGIKPENLEQAEDLKKLERKVKTDNKKIAIKSKLSK